MTTSSFSEALGPLAARLPKVVREHEILRVVATVEGHDRVKAVEKVRGEILSWAQNRSGGRIPRAAWNHQDFEYLSGGRNSAGVRMVDGDIDFWAIRADDPDKAVPGRVWTTEVAIALMGTQAPRFSARLLAATSEGDLDIEPHTPGFVMQVVEKCGLSISGFELSPKPWIVDAIDEAERLADLLVDPDRRLPFLVLSVPEGGAGPLIDALGLSRATIGIAQVVVVAPACTWVLTERFGRLRSVFGGAVRSYFPGFSEESNPYAHRLVLPDVVASPHGVAQTQRWMRWMAASESVRNIRMGKDILAFAAIRAASLRLRQAQLESEGASESDQLAAANARIDALERELGDEIALRDMFADESTAFKDRAETAEAQARSSAFRIGQLVTQLKQRGNDPDEDVALPGGWGEFSDWCDVALSGRVVLSSRARREVRAPKFEDVGQAARCLLWLANEARDRRSEGGGSLGDVTIEEGIRNAHCGGDQYDFDWQGGRYTVEWHVKNGGNTHDPTRCLRIYYFWDEASQQIVVAEMPAHRRTWAT